MSKNLFSGLGDVDLNEFWDIATEGNLSLLLERYDRDGNPQKSLKQMAADHGMSVSGIEHKISRQRHSMMFPARSRVWLVAARKQP